MQTQPTDKAHPPQLSPKPSLGVVALALMNVAAIASLRNLPVMANCGLSLFFYYGLSILIFFIPSALISAELATVFTHKEGGVSTWVAEALGPKWGVFTSWRVPLRS